MRIAIAASVLATLTAAALAGPEASGDADVAKLADAQLGAMAGSGSVTYAKGALFSVTAESVFTSAGRVPVDELAQALFFGSATEHHAKNVSATLSADGKSAWLSFDARVYVIFDDNAGEKWFELRASEVVVRDGAGWSFAGGMWSAAQPNKKIDAAARAGKLDELDPVVDGDPPGDPAVRAAFDAMLARGIDATAAARKDLIAIGSAAGERTTTGAAIAKAWKAAWVGHVALDGEPRIGVAPSGTTAWVAANVRLTKRAGASAFEVPFRLFAVFDRVAGAWTLVHLHFSVPPLPS